MVPWTPVRILPWQATGASQDTGVTAGTTTVQLVKPNLNRKRLVITNISDTRIFIGHRTPGAVNIGIPLNANGGVMVDEPDNTGRIYVGPWYVICSAATKLVSVHEEF